MMKNSKIEDFFKKKPREIMGAKGLESHEIEQSTQDYEDYKE